MVPKEMAVSDCVIRIFDKVTHTCLQPGASKLVGVAGANATWTFLENHEVKSKLI